MTETTATDPAERLPPLAEIENLIREFDRPNDVVEREFASHRRRWILDCLRLAAAARARQGKPG